ncbi:hypothetical protein D3C81_2048100 [compost metagenome]
MLIVKGGSFRICPVFSIKEGAVRHKVRSNLIICDRFREVHPDLPFFRQALEGLNILFRKDGLVVIKDTCFNSIGVCV